MIILSPFRVSRPSIYQSAIINVLLIDGNHSGKEDLIAASITYLCPLDQAAPWHPPGLNSFLFGAISCRRFLVSLTKDAGLLIDYDDSICCIVILCQCSAMKVFNEYSSKDHSHINLSYLCYKYLHLYRFFYSFIYIFILCGVFGYFVF